MDDYHVVNPWGFSDLRGNVWEWCEDAYFPGYEGAPTDGSARTAGSPRGRAVRGGGNQSFDEDCRFARRMGWAAGVRGSQFGFRPAFTPPDR